MPVANLAFVHLDLAAIQLPHLLAVELELLGRNDLLKRSVEELALAVAADAAERRVDPQEAAVEVDDADPDRGMLEGAAEPLLALAERFVRELRLVHGNPLQIVAGQVSRKRRRGRRDAAARRFPSGKRQAWRSPKSSRSTWTCPTRWKPTRSRIGRDIVPPWVISAGVSRATASSHRARRSAR